MTKAIAAEGFCGVAFEVTPGTWVTPAKFFPIRSESLSHSQQTNWRRPIRGLADNIGAVQGAAVVQGSVEIEGIESAIVHFLHASRNTIAKATAGSDYTYTTTPGHSAVTTPKTLSITIVRGNGQVFGYAGCVVVRQAYTLDNDMLVATFDIIGRSEASQTLPTYVDDATRPFGAGEWNVEIPTATPVTDVDTFTLSIDDAGEAQQRLRTSRGPAFIKFGERDIGLTLNRDFESRTDYDAFKALTSQSITILASKGAVNQIQFKLPVAIKDTYEVNLTGQGDMLAATIAYKSVYDPSTSKAYEIMVKTQENIT